MLEIVNPWLISGQWEKGIKYNIWREAEREEKKDNLTNLPQGELNSFWQASELRSLYSRAVNDMPIEWLKRKYCHVCPTWNFYFK